jgi:hypothetical protein
MKTHPIQTLFLLLLASPVAADSGCYLANSPAATLLIPYFEVDLSRPDGRTTLFSVANANQNSVLARTTLWTNRGVPTYSFDIYLKKNDVQSISLRDVLVEGRLPSTGSGAATIPGTQHCTSPLTNPPLSPAALADLQAKHRGLEAADGLCHGAPSFDLAVGYITIDALKDCSAEIRYPTSPGYFGQGGTGVASNRNVLWGDYFLIDPSQNLAQGLEPITLQADPTLTGEATFYKTPGNNRRRLPTTWSARYLNGGAFSGGTDFILWIEPNFGAEGLACDVEAEQYFQALFRSEDGTVALQGRRPVPEFAQRLRLDSAAAPVSQGFGRATITGQALLSPLGVPLFQPVQTVLAPLFSAENRFSIGLNATAVDSACFD